MIFETLIPTLIPLYILIAMGFIGGRYMDINLQSMATITIYFISPVVVFGAVGQLDLKPEYLLLPVGLAFASTIVTFISYQAANFIFRDNLANLIAMGSPQSNSGYFGLPVVLSIYGAGASGLYLMTSIGAEIISITVGYYFGARGSFDVRESLLKVLKLPVLHGLWIGLIWNVSDLGFSKSFLDYWTYFTGAWVVLGMMLIGVALGKLLRFHVNWKLLSYLSFIKFIFWPLLIFAVILFDRAFSMIFDEQVYGLLMIWSLCPLMGNLVAYAALLNVRPDEAAMSVLISTLFALLFMPFVLSITGFL